MVRVRLRAAVTATATLAGFALAHAVTYLAVYHVPAARAQVLDQTGHAYLQVVVAAGWPLLLLGLLASLATGVARAGARRGLAPRQAFLLLAATQCVVYAGAETGERLAARAPLAGLVGSPLLPLGLVVQVAVAAILVGLLVAAAAAGERLRPLTALAWMPVVAGPPVDRRRTPHAYDGTGRRRARAPPRAVAA